MQNVIINFATSPDGLQPGIDKLDEVKEADKAVADQAKKTMDAYAKRDKTISDAAKGSKKSIDDLAGSVKNLDKSLVGGIGGKALDDLRNSIKLTDGQWKVFYQNLIKNAKQELVSASQKEDITQLNQLIAGAEKALASMAEKEELVNKASKSMKAELRQLKQELQQLGDEGKDNTAEFERMAIKAGQLEDQIGDTNARIKALSSDTFVFDALISGVSGLTGAFAIGQGVMALYGEESEEIQKALLKVNAAMSILQGLQAIQNVLQKQSAASIGIDILLRRNQAAATTAQTIATEANATATVAATTAQRGLNLAWLASPAGILLTGITAITAALFAFGSSTNDAKEETDKLNESLEKQRELLAGINETSFIEKMDRLKLRQKGASELEIFQFDVTVENRKLQDAREIYTKALKDRADFEEKNNKIVADIEKKFSKGSPIYNSAINNTVRSEENIKQAEIYNKKVIESSQAVSDQEQNIELFKQEQLTKIAEDGRQKRDKADKKAAKTKEEILKERNEAEIAAARSALARTEAQIIQAKEGSQEELALKLKAIDQEYYAEVLVKGRTIGELEKLDAQYYKKRQDIVAASNTKEAQDAINSRIAQANSVVALSKDGDAVLRAKKELIDAQSDLDAQSIRNSETNEDLRRLKIKAVYDKALADKKQLEKDKTKAEVESILASTLSTIDREITKRKKTATENRTDGSDGEFEADMRAEERKIAAKREANRQLLEANAIDNAEWRLRENELDNQQDEIDIRREERKQARIDQIRQIGFQTAASLLQSLFSISANGHAKDMAQVKELFDQKRISQTEYDNRIRQLRKKQSQDEKAQAIFSTLLQQGPMMLEGFKKGGPFGVAAALALFFSILNTVISTDVPQYRKGKIRIDGPGTDTSDSILARISKNESVINAAQSKKHEGALRAINEDRFESYLRQHELPRIYKNMTTTEVPDFSTPDSSQPEPFDYDRMAGAFANKLAENPQAVVSFDEAGMHLSIRKGQMVTEYKNKKLST